MAGGRRRPVGKDGWKENFLNRESKQSEGLAEMFPQMPSVQCSQSLHNTVISWAFIKGSFKLWRTSTASHKLACPQISHPEVQRKCGWSLISLSPEVYQPHLAPIRLLTENNVKRVTIFSKVVICGRRMGKKCILDAVGATNRTSIRGELEALALINFQPWLMQTSHTANPPQHSEVRKGWRPKKGNPMWPFTCTV